MRKHGMNVLKPGSKKTALCFGVAGLLLGGSGAARAQVRAGSVVPVEGMAVRQEAPRTVAPAPTERLHLSFPLSTARESALEAFVASQHDPHSPYYRHWLTPREVGQRFGAPEDDLRAVVTYARAQGFKVTNVWPNRMFVSADATVSQAEQAFGVKIVGYARTAARVAAGDSPTFHAPDREPQVPVEIARRIKGVFGLSSELQAHPRSTHISGALPATPPPTGGMVITPNFTGPLGPADLSTVYNVDSIHALGLQGQNMAIGIYSPTLVDDNDINSFAATYGLSGYTLTHVPVDGGATDSNGAGEACLDAEMIIGQDPNVQVVFYETHGVNLDIWNKIAADNIAVISDSWSIDEKTAHASNGGDAFVSSWNTILATMDAQGQAHYNSSGDKGAYNATPGVLSVGLPGSSTHVTTVGGTALTSSNADGTWSGEEAWVWDGSSGSGGGLSLYFARPSWQSGPGVSNASSNGMRQTPDIAAQADPGNPGIWVYAQGAWGQIGGTSASAPLWAAINVLIDQGANARSGNLNQTFYYIGTNLNDVSGTGLPFVFHDITTGANGGFDCTPGWDFVTGWGSANFYKLYADLLLRPDLAPYNPGANGPGGAWTSPVMIHTGATSVTEPSTFNDATTYNFSCAVLDQDKADSIACVQSLQIDGVDHFFTQGPWPAGYYYHSLQAASAQMKAGTHTIKLIADARNAVKESNESNNIFTRTITVLNSTSLTGVAVNPATVTGGTAATGTVTLSGSAPAGGVVVTLASNNTNAATVPASVTVAAGSTTATFAVTTRAVAASAGVTITASYFGVNKTAALTVQASALSALTVSPTSLTGGSSSTGTVTLNSPAAPGGAVVSLSNSNTNAATIPASVTVAAGSKTATFTIVTKAVITNTVVSITAASGGVSRSASLTVQAPALSALAVSPVSVRGGTASTGTVTLTGPAPTGGMAVTLASSNTNAATAPASVTVAAGAKTATFTIATKPVKVTTLVTISASHGGVSKSTNLTVTP